MQRGIYKKFKSGETYLKERYTTLTMFVRTHTRKGKREYEMRVARDAESDPKVYFRIYKKTTTKNRIGALKNGL